MLSNAVVVLDGVTSRRPPDRDGGWYATLLAAELARQLSERPCEQLRALLADSIGAVAAAHDLVPHDSPSSTVAMVRWSESTVDALVLADSPVVVFDPHPHVFVDEQLATLRASGRDLSQLRNREGGFWVAEADPSAADHAATASWPTSSVDTVLVMTDGVSCGVEEYGLFSWEQALRLADEHGADAVLDRIQAAERGDPQRQRWPRYKVHDDQALAVIRFR
ncbi:hypothetical protein KALB_8416 [Kutzneria albida DSM 43870]|uniref:PPM-type phosphatase domain-containing protein n=1 Tax=Kutzneria albida DSM 43870 TaxID=1449976 RepID=W5WLP2_9PSEU|nr:hypothetical protein KALB_8416 [Kutzneria albida DSM 43870]